MYRITLLFFVSLAISLKLSAGSISFENGDFRIELNEKGWITSIYDKVNRTEYLPDKQPAPFVSFRINNVIEYPSSVLRKGNVMVLTFKNVPEVIIKPETKKGYFTFELVKMAQPESVDLVIWGPYPTTIREIVGECVGVVRNKTFALGIQALNEKTLGGYPTDENDIEPSYTIFETGNYVDVTSEWRNKKNYRGQTAKVLDPGSVLQAYTRNRNKERIISNWNHDYYVAPPYDDGGVIGSKIALFGCPPEKALETIGRIEINEGLPHPTIDGEWEKTARTATASYLIMGFSEDNLDQALELTKKAGLKYLYHGGPFKTWGHFALDEKSFPHNWKSMKNCVERAAAQGIKLGVHTLSNFITTNDDYIAPVPDPRLARVGESEITADVDDRAEEIPIASPRFFNQMKNNSLHAVVIGNEIIRYKEVSAAEPWWLTGCIRGAFNTEAASHTKGDSIGKLMDHGYKVFLSNADLSAEIAGTIARLFSETGLMQLSFDGLEGNWSTGMGQYGRILFTKTWYDNLGPELKGKVINDASNPSHFNWHINSRYNWGEPWYAGFRESQTQYRLMNQDFYRRNFIPSMLGWFSMSDQTSLEDAEWLLARAAGFDAGFAFNLNLRNVERNGKSDAILKAISTWETARMEGAFSPEQKLRMQDIGNEFHLESTGPGEWNIYPFQIYRYVHEKVERQPGEPVFSTFEFDNPYNDQPLMFILTNVPVEKGNGARVEKIMIEINDYSNLEVPVGLEPGQILKMDEHGKLEVFTPTWNIVRAVTVDGKIPFLSKGMNKIVFDAEFNDEGTSKIKLEVKTIGDGEEVKAAAGN